MRARYGPVGCLLAIGCLWGSVARAEEPAAPEVSPVELVSDRPTFASSASVVAGRYALFELGALFESSEDGQGLSLPGLLVRYGVGAGWELRLGVPSVIWDWPKVGLSDTSVGSVSAGVKYALNPGGRLDVALVPMLSLPIKQAEFDSRGLCASLELAWSVALAPRWGLGGDLLVVVDGLGGDDVLQDAYDLSLNLGFEPADAWWVFLETVGQLSGSGAASGWWLDAGLAWMMKKSLQLDAALGFDLLAEEPALSATIGVSFLW